MAVSVQRERLKAYPSRKNVFPITTKDLKKTSTFCVTFQGSIDLSFGDLRLVCRPWSFKPVALVSGKRFQPFDSFSNEMLCA